MAPIDELDLDVPEVLRRVAQRLAGLPTADRALAERTLDRVQPPNWTLEWRLPWWLGRAFGLPSPLAREVVVSNVIGLIGIRLEDDTADGELAEVDPATARRVAAALVDEAVAVYRPLFDASSPFWAELRAILARWRAADDRLHGRAGDPSSIAALAHRAAPLQIGARAVCRLAGREAAWPDLERCLDHGLAALALYDDVCDWERDVDAGRWNAFVARVGVASQVPEQRDRNRAAVRVAMLTRGAAGEALERVRDEALRCSAAAAALGVEPLAAHFRWLADRAVEQGAAVDRHYASLADRMTQLFLDPSSVAQSPVAGGAR